MGDLHRRNPRLAVALAFLALLCGVGGFAGFMAPTGIAAGGSANTLFVWWALTTRQAVAATLVIGGGASVLGLLFGWLAAFGHPLFLFLFTRLSDVTGALPSLILVGVLRVSHTVPAGLDLVIVLLALRSIEIGHSVRSLLLQLQTSDLLTAARSIGGSSFHVFRYHLFAHLLRPVAAASATTAATVIALEAALSLVGLGLPAGSVSWGSVLGDPDSVSWSLAPALALGSLILTTLSLYVVGQNLRADRRITRRFI